eukprot:4972402-Prymnesium_polylepis.1
MPSGVLECGAREVSEKPTRGSRTDPVSLARSTRLYSRRCGGALLLLYRFVIVFRRMSCRISIDAGARHHRSGGVVKSWKSA